MVTWSVLRVESKYHMENWSSRASNPKRLARTGSRATFFSEPQLRNSTPADDKHSTSTTTQRPLSAAFLVKGCRIQGEYPFLLSAPRCFPAISLPVEDGFGCRGVQLLDAKIGRGATNL